MRARSAAFLMLLGAASCGSRHEAPVAAMRLEVNGLDNGSMIPRQYTCDGGSKRPELSWSAPPANTKSLAVVLKDPDAPNGTFYHWAVYDLPPTRRALAAAAEQPGRSAGNDGGTPGYFAPCPPKGDKPHHYVFEVLGLDVEHLTLSPGANGAELDRQARDHVVGRGELIATYQRR